MGTLNQEHCLGNQIALEILSRDNKSLWNSHLCGFRGVCAQAMLALSPGKHREAFLPLEKRFMCIQHLGICVILVPFSVLFITSNSAVVYLL